MCPPSKQFLMWMCVRVCVRASVCVHVAKKRCMEWVVSSDGRGLKPPQPDICETDFRLPPTSQQGRRLPLTTRETISTCLVQEVKARLSGYFWNFRHFRFPPPSHLGSRSRYKLPPSEQPSFLLPLVLADHHGASCESSISRKYLLILVVFVK